MKNTCKARFVAPLFAFVLILSAGHLLAQSEFTLNDTSGFTSQTLFSTANASGGFDFDSSGDIFYLGGPNSGLFSQSDLMEASAGNYTNSNSILTFPSPISGNFVTVQGSAIYYGYFVPPSSGFINSVTTTGSPINSFNVPDNYDLAFSGATAFVSANVTGTNNEVFTLNTTSGALKAIVNTGGDFSGPVAFDSAGDLIYGGAGVVPGLGGVNGIYVFSAASVQNAITNGTALQLANASVMISDSGNSTFAVVGNNLFEAFNNFGTSTTTLDLYNLANPTAAPTLIGTDSGDFLASIHEFNGSLFLDETDGGTVSNFIEITPVPEPATPWLAVAGVALILALQRRRVRNEAR